MKSTEQKEERLKRVDMHNYFMGKIDEAMNNKRFIEATWLIYSCFENRYFRTIKKLKINANTAVVNVKNHQMNLHYGQKSTV